MAHEKHYYKKLALKLEEIQAQLQVQAQAQAQAQNDTDTIENVGNPSLSNIGNPNLNFNMNEGNERAWHRPRVLSTGVLNTVVGQTAAHIEVANLSTTQTITVRVQVINWNGTAPVILLNQLLTLSPQRHQILSQNVDPFHYEVRIFHPGNPNLIANTFAINEGTSTLPGLTFNQKQLMEIDLNA